MTAIHLSINPTALANLLSNAVEISKEGPRVEHPDAVLLAYQPSPDGLAGHLYSYGCGRYAAGRSRAILDGLPSGDSTSLTITRDHAAELGSALRKISRAADSRVGVALHSEPVEAINPESDTPAWGNLIVAYQDKYLAVLHDADPHGKFDAIWQRVDDLAAVAGGPVAGVALMVGVLNRLGKMKGAASDVADLRTTPLPGVVAAKLGADCVALLGEVNRGSFASGGRFDDGPGSPEQLWPRATTTTSN